MQISPSQPNRRGQPATARIGTLAALPVFFDLKDRPVLLIGGTEAAAWKAELLAAAGAYVEVHALEFCSQMQELGVRDDLSGSITLIKLPWPANAFAGKALVVGDAGTEGEAKAIFCAARAAGIPVNVIDRPAYCSFKFGTIVNRSPVVIGISTSGAAPVLGQVIRTRIEALLPASLADWAQLARDIRGTVLQRFAAGPERRRFWARFAGLAFGPFVGKDIWQAEVNGEFRAAAGRVTIVKAPHRDPGLLTLNAVRHLQGADAIYFDGQIDPAVLDHARREAARHQMPSACAASLDGTSRAIVASMDRGESIVLVRAGGQVRQTSVDRLAELLLEEGVCVFRTDGQRVAIEMRRDIKPPMRRHGSARQDSMNA
jgi:uroporphyrin-III C-methyltransferase / precorrin-2 dehydrogenase / sirohydrochlorin ferrochelatase